MDHGNRTPRSHATEPLQLQRLDQVRPPGPQALACQHQAESRHDLFAIVVGTTSLAAACYLVYTIAMPLVG